MPRRERTLADLGEPALIRRIARRAGHPASAVWPKAIGDDAAILRPRKNEDLVLSTDAQVEGTHFRFERESPRAIGRRALAVNLSDLAAMGARPVGALLSLCAPPELALSVFDGMVAGFVDESRRFDCPLVGGNLSKARECSLTVTVVGRVKRGHALRREGLRLGDLLFVTGELGAAALARLRADRSGGQLRRIPTARIEAGLALAQIPQVRACIDLSDGLASDLSQLLECTGLGAEIDPGSLPSPRGFTRSCVSLGLDATTLQAAGGEDYELLFGLSPTNEWADPRRLGKRLGVSVSRIGHVVRRSGIRGLPKIPTAHHF
ncbi:MAG: thiamine-phosphate kinase [Myxococcales bacterium]|nr:thiamine-phosphate kinase [Myxococcales bacterium]HIK84112.1 thiamine-phosphate kinase [Myxococcales bacterium]